MALSASSTTAAAEAHLPCVLVFRQQWCLYSLPAPSPGRGETLEHVSWPHCLDTWLRGVYLSLVPLSPDRNFSACSRQDQQHSTPSSVGCHPERLSGCATFYHPGAPAVLLSLLLKTVVHLTVFLQLEL